MRNINEVYKEIFEGKQKEFAQKNHKEMNATNIELWHKSRYVFYSFAVLGNLASFAGAAYGIQLFLSKSLPLVFAWPLGIVFSAGLEMTFIYAFPNAFVKIFQGKIKYALPYLFVSLLYILNYYSTTYGFESFVKETDNTKQQIAGQYSKDSTKIATFHNTKIDSLGKRILMLEEKGESLKYYNQITANNELILNVVREKTQCGINKDKRLLALETSLKNNLKKADKGLIQNSQRNYNLALIILIYVLILYIAISVIKENADEEYRMFVQRMDTKPTMKLITEKKNLPQTKKVTYKRKN